MVFLKLGLKDNCKVFSDGKSVVNWFVQHLKDPNAYSKDKVCVVIIDFEMGGINGLEAVKEIRAMYNIINEQLRDSSAIRMSELEHTESNNTQPEERFFNMPVFVMFSVH